WRDWPACRAKSLIARKTFWHIWKTQMVRSFTPKQREKKRRKFFRNRRSRSSICCEMGCLLAKAWCCSTDSSSNDERVDRAVAPVRLGPRCQGKAAKPHYDRHRPTEPPIHLASSLCRKVKRV